MEKKLKVTVGAGETRESALQAIKETQELIRNHKEEVKNAIIDADLDAFVYSPNEHCVCISVKIDGDNYSLYVTHGSCEYVNSKEYEESYGRPLFVIDGFCYDTDRLGLVYNSNEDALADFLDTLDTEGEHRKRIESHIQEKGLSASDALKYIERYYRCEWDYFMEDIWGRFDSDVIDKATDNLEEYLNTEITEEIVDIRGIELTHAGA